MYIITGASRGIGKALAEYLAQHEQNVLITGRTAETLEEIAQTSKYIDFLVNDVSKPQEQVKLVEAIQSRLKPNTCIHGLIHNAGTVGAMAKLEYLSAESWRSVLETNLTAPFVITQGLLRHLSPSHSRVLHIGSGAAYFAIEGMNAYCVSKAGLSMLTRCWQLEYNKFPFASVMPGIIDTNMQAEIRGAKAASSDGYRYYHHLKQNNQLISPETVAQFLGWLILHLDASTFCSQEWDIYDTTHHKHWLNPPYHVPPLDD